jgi:hypothetical protein
MLITFITRAAISLFCYFVLGYFIEDLPNLNELPIWIILPFFLIAVIPAYMFTSIGYLSQIRPDLIETRQSQRLYEHRDNFIYTLIFFLGEYLVGLTNTYYLSFFILIILIKTFMF